MKTQTKTIIGLMSFVALIGPMASAAEQSPVTKKYVQIANLEVANVIQAGTLRSFIVFHRTNEKCQQTVGAKTTSVSCPMGIPSLAEHPAMQGMVIPDRIKPYLETSEKYEIRLAPGATVLDRNRSQLALNAITAGDKLNIYGTFIDADNSIIEVSIIRDTTLPLVAPTPKTYAGVITQINPGDGSFVIRTRDGRLITAKNPFQVNSFVSLKGILDEKTDTLSNLSQTSIRETTEKDAIPFISEVRPGSGTIGTRVTVIGSGFTPTGNAVNIAGVRNVITNIPSPDGRTISFTIPAFACPGGGQMCGTNQLAVGTYNFSIVNNNGTSDVSRIVVTPLPALQIFNDLLPQAVEQERYAMNIEARGGTDSYAWSVTNGSLPQGLQLTQAVCITAPCRAPVAINGTPTVPGTYKFTLVLTSGREKTSKDFSMIVVKAINH